MSEETKNDKNEEVEEETSEEVQADAEEAEETEGDANGDQPAEESDEEESSDDDAVTSDDADDGDDGDDEAETAEEGDDADVTDDGDEAEDDFDADTSDDEPEASDEADDDRDEAEASDEADADDADDEASDESDDDEAEASDESDDEAEASDESDDVDDDVAAETFGEPDSPVRRSGSESVDEVDVEEGELTVEDGEEDPYAGELLTGDNVEGVAAFFGHPDHLLYAAAQTRDSEYEAFDAMSPFPIHGMDDALGVGRSWIPWVTFGAGCAGLMTAIGLQFGIMGFDWPMNFGGKPFIAWPSFVPIMFELTVLFAGVTTGLVMLKAAGCFTKPFIIDTEITNDQFVLWISADDEHFDRDGVIEFMKELHPSEIRTIKKEA